MRIIHTTNSLTRLGGGVPPVVWGLALEQQAANHTVSVFGLKDTFDSSDWPPNRDHRMIVQTFKRNGPCKAGWSRDLHSALLDPSIGGNVDIFHQHGLWTMLSHSAHSWRKRWKLPFVITPHGMLDEPRLKVSKWKKRLFALMYETKNLRAESCIHALCQPEAMSIRNFGSKVPIAVIPNGINLEDYSSLPDAAQFARRFPCCKDRRIVLYLGRIHPLKGLAPLLDAWKQLDKYRRNDWILVVAGINQLGFEDNMKQKAEALGLQDDVLFAGPLYKQAKLEALSATSTFVLPSFSEGFAITVLEAMACKLPLVITHQCNFNEVETEGAGWVGQPNADSMAECLDAALSLSDTERQATGQRGYELVRRKYTWDRVARELELVYNWMLGGGAAPSCVRAVSHKAATGGRAA